MITLFLLHPLKQVPVQNWTFENESVIRIGRSTDNHVILYSAVVSRQHVELRRVDSAWEVVNLGTNGTYVDGKRITRVAIEDGAVIRLARSGPNIQIRLRSETPDGPQKANAEDKTLSQKSDVTPARLDAVDEVKVKSPPLGMIPVPPHLKLPSEAGSRTSSNSSNSSVAKPFPHRSKQTSGRAISTNVCPHNRSGPLFCLDCGQPLRILHTVDDYQLVEVLGQGEVGITYQAWQEGRSLVVKTLNSGWVRDAKAQEAFQQEAEILRRLDHPSVPRYVDFFSQEGQPYLVMEMIHGQSLDRRVATQGPVSQTRAIAWMLEVCNVLEYLHQQTPPILHQDLKPQNVIQRTIPQSGHAIALVDFGGIKTLALQSDVPTGTTSYVAPEQQAGRVSFASDLYALGPILVYLLTGEDPGIFFGNRDQGYRLYAEYVPGLSAEMVAVIRTLTNLEPEQRYSSASDLAEVLREISQAEGQAARDNGS